MRNVFLGFVVLGAILAGIQPARAREKVVSFSGTGSQGTKEFVVDAGWELRWEFVGARFEVTLNQLLSSVGDLIVTQAESGSGVITFNRGGIYHLTINGTGQWSVDVFSEMSAEARQQAKTLTESRGSGVPGGSLGISGILTSGSERQTISLFAAGWAKGREKARDESRQVWAVAGFFCALVPSYALTSDPKPYLPGGALDSARGATSRNGGAAASTIDVEVAKRIEVLDVQELTDETIAKVLSDGGYKTRYGGPWTAQVVRETRERIARVGAYITHDYKMGYQLGYQDELRRRRAKASLFGALVGTTVFVTLGALLYKKQVNDRIKKLETSSSTLQEAPQTFNVFRF